MRKLILFLLAAMLLLAGFAVAIALAVHWAGPLHGVTMSIDGETLEGPAVAALFGGATVIGLVVACLLVILVLASVAIVVPIALAAAAIALLTLLFAGLAPIAIPVLLVVGAYVLLSRRARRRALPVATSLPPSTSPS